MIQQAVNGMLAILLANWALNDLPHAAGLVGNPSNGRWEISIGRHMVGADVIPGVYTTSQVPRKVRELMAVAPPELEAIHVSVAEEPEIERPGPLLPTIPRLKEPEKLWVVDAVGPMGSSELGTCRAFLVPELVRRHLPTMDEGEAMRISPYEEW